MVDKDIFQEDISNQLGGEICLSTPTQWDLEKSKIKAQMEIEKKEWIELEFRRREITMKRPKEETRSWKFDVSKQVNLVRKFQESEVDDYFQHLGKTMINLEWLKAVWPMLLQTALSRKLSKHRQHYQ